MAKRVVAEVTNYFGDDNHGGQGSYKQTGTATINSHGQWRVKLVHSDTGQNCGYDDDQTVGLGDSYREARDAALAASDDKTGWRELVALLDDEVFEADEDEDEDATVHM